MLGIIFITSGYADKKLREAFNKKNGKFHDIVQKGGRGSDQEPNFINKEKKW